MKECLKGGGELRGRRQWKGLATKSKGRNAIKWGRCPPIEKKPDTDTGEVQEEGEETTTSPTAREPLWGAEELGSNQRGSNRKPTS